jgi:hypothetical protein
MPNIATALRQEISRIARKEIRGETNALKKAAATYRGEIRRPKATYRGPLSSSFDALVWVSGRPSASWMSLGNTRGCV